jgi:hypothetical protein
MQLILCDSHASVCVMLVAACADALRQRAAPIIALFQREEAQDAFEETGDWRRCGGDVGMF